MNCFNIIFLLKSIICSIIIKEWDIHEIHYIYFFGDKRTRKKTFKESNGINSMLFTHPLQKADYDYGNSKFPWYQLISVEAFSSLINGASIITANVRDKFPIALQKRSGEGFFPSAY